MKNRPGHGRELALIEASTAPGADDSTPRSGPDDRDRPRARPRRQAGGGRAGRHHRRVPHADGRTATHERDALRGARPGRGRRRRPLPHRGGPRLVVPVLRASMPWPAPPGPAPRSAAWSSTPTPSSPRPRSTSSPSRSSGAGWSTSTAGPPPGSRSSSTASMGHPPCRDVPSTPPISAARVRSAARRSSGPGRRPSPPTPRAGSPSPASAAASRSRSPSTTPASPSRNSTYRAEATRRRQGGLRWPCSPRRSSRAACWPPTPASPSRTP